MRLLLDTHTLLWWLFDLPPLGRRARALIAAETVLVSAVSAAEIAIKSALGKLQAPDDLEQQIDAHGFTPLPLHVRHALGLAGLPPHHRDPFDRLLIAQARDEGLTILTADGVFGRYEVPTIDAGP
ncbi:MAG: type II toxin-antitoxin system VapC family toxin [Jiangellaceae bacterium]